MSAFGVAVDPESLGRRLRRNPDGGTLATHLGLLAIELGWRVRLYPLGTRIFDPTWWELEPAELVELLSARGERLPDGPARDETLAWRDVLAAGGKIRFVEPEPAVLVDILGRDRPIVCGLSATWLYREARTDPDTNQYDAVHGLPTGHFVTLAGYTGGGRHIHVVDPSPTAPFDAGGARTPDGPRRAGRYPLPASRLIHAILLGDTTGDAVLLELWPPPGAHPPAPLDTA